MFSVRRFTHKVLHIKTQYSQRRLGADQRFIDSLLNGPPNDPDLLDIESPLEFHYTLPSWHTEVVTARSEHLFPDFPIFLYFYKKLFLTP